ncbi:MAG: glycosyltransferase family 4 protein [Tagaea sp.]
MNGASRPFRVAAMWRTPIYQWLGGDHPMMTSLLAPRAGYEFLLDMPRPDGPARARAEAKLHALAAKLRLAAPGVSDADLAEFVKSREIDSQAEVEAADPDLVFPHSMPFVDLSRPWISHLEELLPLFAPFFWHGTSAERSAHGTPVWRLVKAMLEDPSCRALSSHLRHTVDWIGRLFESPTIAAKTRYIPFGHALPKDIEARVAGAQASRDGRRGCTFLFTNSWFQAEASFVLRGGMEILAAYGNLVRKRPDVRLILRSQLPVSIFGAGFGDFVRGLPNVEIVDGKLDYADFVDLFLRADAFLLPSCGLHTVSLIEAMATGTAVIASDAPAVDEFVTHGETGLAVEGRRKLSWYDEHGFLRQTFEPLKKEFDAEFAARLESAMDRVAGDAQLRHRLGTAAYDHVRKNHAMGPWLDGFGRMLDEVHEGLR